MSFFLLKEDGDFLLKEDGDKIINNIGPPPTIITTSIDILYNIEALGAVRVTPKLTNFEFNRKVTLNMK